MTWKPNDDTNLYGFWTRGNRSGGYNLRQASAQAPGPYDQETEDSFEIRLKKRLFDRTLTFNLQGFSHQFSKNPRDHSSNDTVPRPLQLTETPDSEPRTRD